MSGWDSQRDAAVRVAAMAYVQRELDQSGGVISRQQLEDFIFDGEQIKLIDQSRGIRNPAQLPATLTILTNPRGPYDDAVGPDGYPRYKIRTGDWARGDNRKLHEAFERDVPLIWLQTVRPRVFVATDVLTEVDGPMLRHGLQDFHGRTLMAVPSRALDRPDPERLEQRYAEFRAAG